MKNLVGFRDKDERNMRKVLLTWLNYYVGEKGLGEAEVPERCRTGVLLVKMLRRYGCEGVGHIEPRSREECLSNIRCFLEHLQTQGFHGNADLLLSIYQGKSLQIWRILEYFLFEIHIKSIKTLQTKVLNWLNDQLLIVIDYDSLNSLWKPPLPLLTLLSQYIQTPPKLQNLPECLKSLKIPCFFAPPDLPLSPDLFYLQLYSIYTCLSDFQLLSTNTSSKSSLIPSEISFNSSSRSKFNDIEKKIANEERKLMHLSDIRRIKELNLIVRVPSVKELPHSSSQCILTEEEKFVCYLITPRIVQILIERRLIRVLVSVVPDETKFSLKREQYLFECKELGGMASIFFCELSEISEIKSDYIKSIFLLLRRQQVQITFKSSEECERYYQALNFLRFKH